MPLFSKGIILTQNKEPALSKKTVDFVGTTPTYFVPDIPDIQDIENLNSRDIIAIAKQAQIIDESDGRPLVSKFRRAENIADSITVDAIDDEPYVSSKLNALVFFQDEINFALNLCVKVADTQNITIQTYRNVGDTVANIPTKIGAFPVKRISGGYPALPSVTHFQDKGRSEEMIVGVCALIHLARAVIYNRVQTTTFLTVAGNSIANPMNLEVSLGTSFSEVIERCGLVARPNKVVSGGSMTGISVIDTDATTVTPTTRSVLAFHGKSFERAYSCIGCGRCEQNCPSGLNPMYINKIMAKKSRPQLSMYQPQYCIKCGTCSYVCPSRLDVFGSVKNAKKLIEAQETVSSKGSKGGPNAT